MKFCKRSDLFMKRLVYILMIVCLMIPCMAYAEELTSDVFAAAPEELIQEPVDEALVLPEGDDLLLLPSVDVDGPEPYRELVLLQPTNLSGEAIDVNTVRLSWDAVAFTTQYDVYRKLLGEAEYTRIATTPANKRTYDDTSVTPGQVAYYRVQALNVSYNGEESVVTYSPQSNTLPFVTLEAPVLADPRGLDDNNVRLNWQTVAGATTYEVELAQVDGGTFALAREGLTGALCNVSGLDPAKSYYFRVRAVRTFSSGEKFYSAYSNIGCGIPLQRPVLTITGNDGNAVLSWTETPGAVGYVIYRKVGAEGSYSKLTITDAVTSYVDSGLTPGEVCYYFVYAMTPSGSYNCFSLSSFTRYFTIVDAVEITGVTNVGYLQQQVIWEKIPSGANKVEVYRASAEDGPFEKVDAYADVKAVVTGLEDGKTYFYKIRGVREFSNGDVSYGPWSAVVSLAEEGSLVITDVFAVNETWQEISGEDISGGYVGDVFGWSATVSGGSGKYDFRYLLADLDSEGYYVLKDYDGVYIEGEENQTEIADFFALTLTDVMIDLVTKQGYAMQIEVMDSEKNTGVYTACAATLAEMNLVAAKPVTKMINVTLRAGETYEMVHGIVPAAGDKVIMDASNPTGAVSISGNTVNAQSNGYCTVLITPERYVNDVLIAYNFTVGYAKLSVNSVTPSVTETNYHNPLTWTFNFSGGRSAYRVNTRVYCGDILMADNTVTEKNTGSTTVSFQPTTAGEYFLEVNVTSADGQTATKRSAVTAVEAYDPVKVSAAAQLVGTGNEILWNIAYTGNSTVVSQKYTVYHDGLIVATAAGVNESVFSYTPSKTGSYFLQVVVEEESGTVIDAASETVTVVPGEDLASGNGVVTGNRVALREKPNTSANVILRVEKGESVYVIRREGSNWYYVSYNGKVGYMYASLIKLAAAE